MKYSVMPTINYHVTVVKLLRGGVGGGGSNLGTNAKSEMFSILGTVAKQRGNVQALLMLMKSTVRWTASAHRGTNNKGGHKKNLYSGTNSKTFDPTPYAGTKSLFFFFFNSSIQNGLINSF